MPDLTADLDPPATHPPPAPVIGGTGWALGNGTLLGRFCQHGKTVNFLAAIIWGSTSTFGTGDLTITTPVLRRSIGTNMTCAFLDVSTSKLFGGFVYLDSVGAAVPRVQVAASGGELAAVTATAPFAWAAGDALSLNGTYEAA
jgi:hypothetical protein